MDFALNSIDLQPQIILFATQIRICINLQMFSKLTLRKISSNQIFAAESKIMTQSPIPGFKYIPNSDVNSHERNFP